MKVSALFHDRTIRFHHPPTMDVFYAYTYSTAAWFGIQAVPLIISPKLIITALSTEARKPTGRWYLELLLPIIAINTKKSLGLLF